jgi:hypothetical protein
MDQETSLGTKENVITIGKRVGFFLMEKERYS